MSRAPGASRPGRRRTPRCWLVRARPHAPGGLDHLLTAVRATPHPPGAGRGARPGGRQGRRTGLGWPAGCRASCRGAHPLCALASQARSPGPPVACGPPPCAHVEALPRGHTWHRLQAHPRVARAPAGVSAWAGGTPGGGNTPPRPAHPQASGPATGSHPAWSRAPCAVWPGAPSRAVLPHRAPHRRATRSRPRPAAPGARHDAAVR